MAQAAQYQGEKKKKTQSKKLAEDQNRHFAKEDIQMADKHMKRCSTVLIIKDTQIKSTMRYDLTAARRAIIKKKKSVNNKCWKDVDKRESS